MRAYWPEAKMLGKHKDVTMYDNKGNAHVVEIEVAARQPRCATVHYDASSYLGRDIACGFLPSRAVTTSTDTADVTCRACIACIHLLFDV